MRRVSDAELQVLEFQMIKDGWPLSDSVIVTRREVLDLIHDLRDAYRDIDILEEEARQ